MINESMTLNPIDFRLYIYPPIPGGRMSNFGTSLGKVAHDGAEDA